MRELPIDHRETTSRRQTGEYHESSMCMCALCSGKGHVTLGAFRVHRAKRPKMKFAPLQPPDLRQPKLATALAMRGHLLRAELLPHEPEDVIHDLPFILACCSRQDIPRSPQAHVPQSRRQ
eukprot:gnl/TRDRNA2_/TRDRNA2_152233_c0_seq1.p1 gnl/TRDRNA2_/TRDRNA2_152233_c0~~gnl/TRDRNA2_/TRDRNA2_152233_c0_seq1.p1  ORF type:complete len:121 (-),score=7.00 gnl/TRDRNA2_/TRDRNA2_152233_c0_seq1:116-478(-)